MGRRNPLCAVCGESLKAKNLGGIIKLLYEGLPGKPEIGWHGDCLNNEQFRDSLMRDLREDSDTSRALDKLTKILKTIDRRGLGRLVANKQWKGAEDGDKLA